MYILSGTTLMKASNISCIRIVDSQRIFIHMDCSLIVKINAGEDCLNSLFVAITCFIENKETFTLDIDEWKCSQKK